jgi:predicted acetyltransferase
MAVDDAGARPGRPAGRLSLVEPSLERLARYAAALATGWSPSTSEDVSAKQLTALRHDPQAFLRELTRRDGTRTLPDGRLVQVLPGPVLWIWDGDFCGSINLRYQPGSHELPDYVSGHIGYAIVPWRRRLGYATRALALMLAHARAVGLERVLITCDEDNVGSRKVILGNGGQFAGTRPAEAPSTKSKLQFWVPTSSGAGISA